MEVKQGYKQTDVGVIPENWEVKTLGEIGDVRMCKRVLKHQTRAHGEIPFYKIGTFGGVSDAFISRVLFDEFKRKYSFPRKGDVLISAAGTIGRSVVYDGEPAYFQDSNIVWIENDESRATNVYLWYRYQVTKWAVTHGGTVARLYNENLRTKIHVPIPPIQEQRAITAALSDVDALLGALDRLIAKKLDLKQAAMQQLLTGQIRLPGFGGEWEATTLGTLGDWFSGGTPSKSNETYWSGDIPWVSPKDMKVARVLDAIDHVGTTAIGNGTRLLPTGAVLVVVRGMILAHSAPVARLERPATFNQDIKGLVVRSDIDSNFVLWWLVAHEALLLSLTNEATHGTKRIPTDELLKLQFRVPARDEQVAVARVVTDMDTELEVLEQRRDKTRLLKQGMMQELLTGRTRLA